MVGLLGLKMRTILTEGDFVPGGVVWQWKNAFRVASMRTTMEPPSSRQDLQLVPSSIVKNPAASGNIVQEKTVLGGLIA